MLFLYRSNSFHDSSENYSSDANTEEISEDIKDSTIPIEIQTINADMIDEVVAIEGKITKINRHKNGHLFITVSDSSGEILVPIFADKEIDRDMLNINNEYRFTGRVEMYEGNLEIIPESWDDVVLLQEYIYAIEEIDSSIIGETVLIEGKITDIYKHKNGHLFLTVTDSTGEIQVPVFADKEIDRDILEVNKKYRIAGEVQEYKGKLEIIPEKIGDIKEISD